MTERSPKPGDVVILDDEGRFTYVEEEMAELTPGLFEIFDPSGEMFIVERAADRDDDLRRAVHDDGKRVAWRLATIV